MRRFKLLLILLTLLTYEASSQNILYVGNSLTYSNDLPSMVESIARKLGKSIRTECICLPNYGLEDHWKDGIVQSKINSGTYDYVVFQQGPSSQSYGRSSLIEYGGLISNLAVSKEAKPVYFMVWPSADFYSTIEGVIKNYRDAAIQNNAMLINGGEIWKRFNDIKNSFMVYSKDRFHPSIAGSFLMALAHIKTIFPDTNVKELKHRNFRRWIKEEEVFLKMIDIVITQESKSLKN